MIRRCNRTASCPKAPSSNLCRLKREKTAADPVKEEQEDAAPPYTQAVAHVHEVPRRAAPDEARTTPRPSRVDGSTARVHPRAAPLIHHATWPRLRSPRRAATSSPEEPTTPRRAPPPPQDASIRRPRVNHTRVHLVHDRLPHEASRCCHRRAHSMPCPGMSKSRRPCRHPCGRSRWCSNNNAPFQGRRMNRPSPPSSNTTPCCRRRAHPPSALQLRRSHRHAQSFHVAPNVGSAGALVCGRSIWLSNNTAPFLGQRMSRPSPPASNTTPRSRRRARRAGPRRRWH